MTHQHPQPSPQPGLTQDQVDSLIRAHGLWGPQIMQAARQERLERVMRELRARMKYSGEAASVTFDWEAGSQSGLPLPIRVTLSDAQGAVVASEAVTDGDTVRMGLNDIPSYQDWLGILEENFDSRQGECGSVTLALGPARPVDAPAWTLAQVEGLLKGGGAWGPELKVLADRERQERVISEIASVLGVSGVITGVVFEWSEDSEDGHPQPTGVTLNTAAGDQVTAREDGPAENAFLRLQDIDSYADWTRLLLEEYETNPSGNGSLTLQLPPHQPQADTEAARDWWVPRVELADGHRDQGVAGSLHDYSALPVMWLDNDEHRECLYVGLDHSQYEVKLCADVATPDRPNMTDLFLFDTTAVLALALSPQATRAVSSLQAWDERRAPDTLLNLAHAFAAPGVVDELYARLFTHVTFPEVRIAPQ